MPEEEKRMGKCNLPLLMTIVVLSVVGLASLAGAQTGTCAQNLVPCAAYFNSSTPAANCCSSIKEAVDTQLDCLCGLYNSPGLLKSFGITVEQALNLSRACGVTRDLSKCSNVSSSTPRYTAADNIALNCGTRGNPTAMDKRQWIGEIHSKFTPIEEGDPKSNASTSQIQDSSVKTVPYKTARVSYSQFMYQFVVTPGPKFVRFYFYPASYSGFEGAQDFFTVKANSFTLLSNFSAKFFTGDKTLYKEFCINVEKDQKLNLTFIPISPRSSSSSKFYAFINGIEIVSMPDDLYYVAEGDPGVPHVGHKSMFSINNEMALEMVFRFNVGGSVISPVEDTGMFREWSLPDGYYWMDEYVIHREFSFTPIYTKISDYTAPDDVYRSAVSINTLTTNLTLNLPVNRGFNYLVRFHFCELVSQITERGQRVFQIIIDNKIAQRWADVIAWAGRNETPVCKDYVVEIQNTDNLFTTLLPNLLTTDGIRDAILNGMEVFKLSGKDNNLAVAGPDPENVLPPSPSPAQPPADVPTASEPGPESVSPAPSPTASEPGPESVSPAPSPTASEPGPESVSPAPSPTASEPGPESVSPAPSPTASESKKEKTKYLAIASVAGLVVLTLFSILLWGPRNTNRRPEPDKENSTTTTRIRASSLPEELCRGFSLDEIKTATHNFHEELIIGVGGFGNVYKGLIDDGTLTVAIKRLNPESKQGLHEFWTEIEMLSLLRHIHLVSLIGFCNEEGEMILVYDYMTNGTLRHHLYETPNRPLSWKQRLKICIGAASGLNYLHTGLEQPIIHRDVKTSNILLNNKWVAKVSDFGLSKTGQENTAVTTLVKGTWGYLDPDYMRRRQLTEKSDVYSFGVVLFEVLCARKALDKKIETEQWHLANWARKCIERETIGGIIDPNLKGKIAPQCFKVYVEVAESCVRDQGIQRPTMNDVMEKLRFALELQENSDAVKEKINPGGEHSYPEIGSFRLLGTTGVSRNNNVYSEHMLETDSGTEPTTTGLTYPSLHFDTITTQDALQDATDSKV